VAEIRSSASHKATQSEGGAAGSTFGDPSVPELQIKTPMLRIAASNCSPIKKRAVLWLAFESVCEF
jgi:hypothetical protein